ncbi:hypothetical protein EDD18DRAFT_1351918 [Armillaria luteobubalina]|uniref:Uncharacterized protein n=1 Tax=Armillaria luteobubalina TaxID=153913 RepID=A0AA39Q6I7_9AGAR|nr:hypothetical protein EDD18DRAFT_1351918 [Armillaria luteobubalina]
MAIISLLSMGTSSLCSMQGFRALDYCQNHHYTDPGSFSEMPAIESNTESVVQLDSPTSNKDDLFGYSPLAGYLFVAEKDLVRSIQDFGSMNPKATVQSSLAVAAIRELRQQSVEVGDEVENFTRELKSETDTHLLSYGRIQTRGEGGGLNNAAGLKKAAERMAASLNRLQKHAQLSLTRLKTLIRHSDECLEQLSSEAESRRVQYDGLTSRWLRGFRSDEKERTCKRRLEVTERMLSRHLEISDYLAQASHGLGSIQADIEALKVKTELLTVQDLPLHEMQDHWAGLITLRTSLLVKRAGDVDYLGDASVAALKYVGAHAHETMVELLLDS